MEPVSFGPRFEQVANAVISLRAHLCSMDKQSKTVLEFWSDVSGYKPEKFSCEGKTEVTPLSHLFFYSTCFSILFYTYLQIK